MVIEHSTKNQLLFHWGIEVSKPIPLKRLLSQKQSSTLAKHTPRERCFSSHTGTTLGKILLAHLHYSGMLWPCQGSPAWPEPQVLPPSLQCCIGDTVLPVNTSDEFKTWRGAASTFGGVETLCFPSSFPPIPMQGLGLCTHLCPAACKCFWVHQLRESLSLSKRSRSRLAAPYPVWFFLLV